MSVDELPFETWSEDDEALREIARLARDLPRLDADEARRRLGRLTDGQRLLVEDAVRRMAEGLS